MWWQLAGSLLAVAAIIGIIASLGFGRDPVKLDEREAREIADHAYGGFSQAEWILSADKRHALLQSPDGRIALVHPHGLRSMARLVGPSDLAGAENPILTIAGSPGWRLDLGSETETWERRIAKVGQVDA